MATTPDDHRFVTERREDSSMKDTPTDVPTQESMAKAINRIDKYTSILAGRIIDLRRDAKDRDVDFARKIEEARVAEYQARDVAESVAVVNRAQHKAIGQLEKRVLELEPLESMTQGQLERVWTRLRALEDASGSMEPGTRCQYCGLEIHKARPGRSWRHLDTNQMSCGTVAQP